MPAVLPIAGKLPYLASLGSEITYEDFCSGVMHITGCNKADALLSFLKGVIWVQMAFFFYGVLVYIFTRECVRARLSRLLPGILLISACCRARMGHRMC